LCFSFPGSAQLLFNKTDFVEFTACNETVVIPCFISNLGTKNINELYIKWIFKGKNVLIFDGAVNRSSPHPEFSSAKIDITELLKGNASLKLNKVHAIVGNYTCEVTVLIREGETTVELKYRVGK
jgi:CD47 antigen (integrin-associated signal transducer)